MESFVAVMAMIAASVMEPGIYFALNSPPAVIGKTVEDAAQVISGGGTYWSGAPGRRADPRCWPRA